MRNYLTLGSSPSDESCAQVGSDNYAKQVRMETRALINQLERIHPVPGEGQDTALKAPSGWENCSFLPYYAVRSFPHDFGSYHEVCAIYDDNHELSVQWAYKAEELFPEEWDRQARNELTAMGYVFQH